MAKHLVICADGTWNRPEEEDGDVPTNILRLARAVRPVTADGSAQHVFYDWGVGSYYDRVRGGVAGLGIHKNIMDAYRYIVQNYTPGCRIYLFGYSRGAYTVRALCGLINNCGILKRPDARRIIEAFSHYKRTGEAYRPSGKASVEFRKRYSHRSRRIHFVGAFDTVGALGIPFSVLGLFDKNDEFYDTKLGGNVAIARHALAIDERREDFEPTLWEPRAGLDLDQAWFAGSHGDVGGGIRGTEAGEAVAADEPLAWMMAEATAAGLQFEPHLRASLRCSPTAKIHDSRRHIYRLRRAEPRPLEHTGRPTRLHPSVRARWHEDPGYRPPNLRPLLEQAEEGQ